MKTLILLLFNCTMFSQTQDTGIIKKVIDSHDFKTVTVIIDPVELTFPYEDDNTPVVINNSTTDIIKVVANRTTIINECVGLNITQYYQLKTYDSKLINQLVVFSQHRNVLTNLNINCFN